MWNKSSSIPQNSSCTATNLPSIKPFKSDGQDMLDTSWRSKGELISSVLLWSPFHTNELVLDVGLKQLCTDTVGSRIHQMHLRRRVRHPTTTNECPGYNTKQSNGEVPVILELWGMRSTPSLPSLPDPLWPGVVVPFRALSMTQIELNKVLLLSRIVWIRTVWQNWKTWNRNIFDK